MSFLKTGKLSAGIAPYRGVLLFLALLFFFHYSWKICIDGDGSEVASWILRLRRWLGISVEGTVDESRMYFLGRDVTPAWFDTANHWLAAAAAWFVRLFPSSRDLLTNDIYLYFPEERIYISIVWGCTGLKQMSIFAGIMLCYWGPFLKKLWYIPLGCVVLTVYNVIRIGMTVILTRNAPERFDSLHDGIFRYIYYTIVFLLWVVWAERFCTKQSWKR
jgi:exosortase/archaeosortase family protein